MKKIILSILSFFLICGCKSIPTKTIVQKTKDDIQITTIEEADSIDVVKKFNEKIYYTKHNNPTIDENVEKYTQDSLNYNYKNEEKKLVESSFYQGKIYDYYIYKNKLIYADFDPYLVKTEIILFDMETNKKIIIDSLFNFIPQMYCLNNVLYYVKYDKDTSIIKYNLNTLQTDEIATYPLQEIKLYGSNDGITWYINNKYYIFNDSLKDIVLKNTFHANLAIDNNHLYCIEKTNEDTVLACYNLKNYEYFTCDIYITSFVITSDYLVVNFLDQKLSIYDKNTMEKVGELEISTINDIYSTNNNEIIITLNENEYTAINLKEFFN